MMSKKLSEFYFPAGEMTIKDKKVHANPDRGILRFFISPETQMLTLKWENIEKKTSNEEIIITPGEYTYNKVSTKKGNPFYIISPLYPDDKYFYYFQINQKDKIEKLEKKIKYILDKGELPPKRIKKSEPVPIPNDFLPLNRPRPSNNTADIPPLNQNLMQKFADILKKMKQKHPSLGNILTGKKITKLFESLDDEGKKRLIDLLPEKQKTIQGFYDNINSAQFKQGCDILSLALDSGNLPSIISSFHLDINEAQKYEDGVEAFIKSIIAKYSPKEDEKKEKKEDKK